MSISEKSSVDETPMFAARLTPYRSLSAKGFILLMCFVGVTCFISGMLFLAIGAWPVFGFFVLDAFLIWLAFKMNYRSARGYEEIAVWPHKVKVRRFNAAGRVTEHVFNPMWTRFRVDRHEEYGIMAMGLATKDRQLAIGSFLNPADRESFARAFSSALAKAKAG